MIADGETRLWIAVLKQAASDAQSKSSVQALERDRARRFLASNDSVYVAALVGVDPDVWMKSVGTLKGQWTGSEGHLS